MGDDDDGNAPLPVDFLQQLQNLAGGLGVQGGGGFVTQQHLRVGCQGSCNGNALLLAAGELHRVGPGFVGKPHGFQQLLGSGPGLFFGNARQLHGEADVIQGRALVQEVEALEDHGDFSSLGPQLLLGQGQQVFSVEEHLAAVRPLQQVDAPDQGALSRTA